MNDIISFSVANGTGDTVHAFHTGTQMKEAEALFNRLKADGQHVFGKSGTRIDRIDQAESENVSFPKIIAG